MQMIKDNISNINRHINSICQRLGISSDDITLIGITKYVDSSKIKEIIDGGVTNIGENIVKDAAKKFSELGDYAKNVTKHLVGHLQTNKAKEAVAVFDLIQSVDRLKLACEINKHAINQNKIVNVLIQVNTSCEAQKSGVEKEHALALIKDISGLKNIRILGLMTVAMLSEDKGIIKKNFKDLRILRDEVKSAFRGSEQIQMKYLSMGMSADYEIAIEEGANMIRIGRAITQ
ncbi:MAG TPA: YggS family pyridoxal phosphate-dependent enzyme [Candidatus Omnitrophica bacterium]|nr:YggS family pyridoxal phosphate-dependent enzyme [Candidatus Omnitrophota bacterium]